METRRIAVGELRPTVELFSGEPALVGESELQLVAVVRRRCRAQDGIDGRDGHLGDTLHGVNHLLLLALQLVLVGQMLPLAAAAQPKVLTHRLHAQLTRLDQALDMPLGKAMLLAVNLQVNHITWSAKRHKHHQVVPAAQALTLGCHARNLKILNNRNIFFLSHRGCKGTKNYQTTSTTRQQQSQLYCCFLLSTVLFLLVEGYSPRDWVM